MINLNQYVTVRLERSGEKWNKIPHDFRTGKDVNPHDPVNWMSLEAARASGQHVGFVLTSTDPYFCIDLDNALGADGEWSDFAKNILSRFPSAFVEVSLSGTGLHIWGRYGDVPVHGTRKANVPGIEIYTRSRFILLGDQSTAIGNIEIDHSESLKALINELFDAPQAVSASWSNRPVEGWEGPEDDDELITAMLKAHGGGERMFGRKVSIAQLWNGDVEAFKTHFPDGSARGYDQSAVDSALASHLAFWTGKNCERIERLMRKSALVRDKWDKHKSYMSRTILNAVGSCQNVYNRPKVTVNKGGLSREIVVRKGFQYLSAQDQIKHFEGCCYIAALHKAFTPKAGLLDGKRFDVVYGGYAFAIDANSKTTKSAWEAFTQSQALSFPKAHGMCFRPECESGSIINQEGETLVNSYREIKIDAKPGDIGPFLNHITKLFPNDRDRQIILSWAAACVQHRGVKFQWSPLIQGGEGNGKSLLGRCLAYAVGHRYTHIPKAKEIGSKFNNWVEGNLLALVEEIYIRDRHDVLESMKELITNDRLEIEGKGGDKYTGDNRCNLIFMTNHKDAIPITVNKRRYCIFYTPQQTFEDIVAYGLNGDYFPKLYNWLKSGGYSHVAHFLMNYKIAEEFNPATLSHRAPTTSSTEEALSCSLGRAEQEMLDAVETGNYGFRGGWLSSLQVKKLLHDVGIKMGPRRLGEMIESLGYVKHPGLAGGRTTKALPTEGFKRTILYCLPNMVDMRLVGDAVVEEYVKANNSLGGGGLRVVK